MGSEKPAKISRSGSLYQPGEHSGTALFFSSSAMRLLGISSKRTSSPARWKMARVLSFSWPTGWPFSVYV